MNWQDGLTPLERLEFYRFRLDAAKLLPEVIKSRQIEAILAEFHEGGERGKECGKPAKIPPHPPLAKGGSRGDLSPHPSGKNSHVSPPLPEKPTAAVRHRGGGHQLVMPEHEALMAKALRKGKRPQEIKGLLETRFGRPLPFGICSVYTYCKRIRESIEAQKAEETDKNVCPTGAEDGMDSRVRGNDDGEAADANVGQAFQPAEDPTKNPPSPPFDKGGLGGISDGPDHIPDVGNMINGRTKYSDSINYDAVLYCKRTAGHTTTTRQCLIHQHEWRSGKNHFADHAMATEQLGKCRGCDRWIVTMAELADLAEEAEETA